MALILQDKVNHDIDTNLGNFKFQCFFANKNSELSFMIFQIPQQGITTIIINNEKNEKLYF